MSDKIVNDDGLDIIFREARSYNTWVDRDVSRPLMQAVFDLLKMAPTSANCSPARFIFLTSEEAKNRLKPHLLPGNVDKTMSSPCCVLIANDVAFFEHLPKLFPHADAKSWFEGNEALIAETATRNGTLQGAYFMIAARALGLDCGPMSGFDKAGVTHEFLSGTNFEANFLCNIGYGDAADLFPRTPRFDFDDVCQVI